MSTPWPYSATFAHRSLPSRARSSKAIVCKVFGGNGFHRIFVTKSPPGATGPDFLLLPSVPVSSLPFHSHATRVRTCVRECA